MQNTTNTFLKYLVLSGLFSIPFIVLIVSSNMFFPFITGKNFTFRIIVEIIFFIWLILAMRDSEYRPKSSYIFTAFASFVGIMAVADFFGENPMKSFWSNYERMEGFVTLIHLLALFTVMGSLMKTRVIWDRLFKTSLFVSFIVCIYSFFQLAGSIEIHQGGVRVDATFGNATYLAIYMVVHIFLGLMFMLRNESSKIAKILFGILIVLQTIVLYHTATRGAILGLIGGILLSALLIAIFGKDTGRIRKFSFGVVILVAVLVLGFIGIKDTKFVQDSPVLSRFSNISLNENKTQARSFVWPMAIQGFKEKPLLGWGQENFNYVFNEHYDPRMYRHEPWFDRTHNVVLDWLVAGGILGLLGYLSLYGAALFAIWKKGDLTFVERSILTGLFAAYFFHNLFVFDNITSYILFIWLLGYLHFDTAKNFEWVVFKRLANLFDNRVVVNRFLAPIAVVSLFFTVYYLNAKPIAANTTLIEAISNSPNTSFEGVINNFKKALAYDTFGNQEIREQLVQGAFTVANSSNFTNEDKELIYTVARDEYKKMIEEAPNDTRHHLFLGILYNMYHRYEEGLEQLKKASELSPKKQSILIEIGNDYLVTGKNAEALSYFKEAYDLAPEYEVARISYAIGAIYSGDRKLLEEILIPAYGTIAYPNDNLIQAYVDTKQYGLVIEIWQNQVKANPTNAQARTRLAAAYHQAGRRTEAIAELQRALELETDENQKKQIEGAISELRAGR